MVRVLSYLVPVALGLIWGHLRQKSARWRTGSDIAGLTLFCVVGLVVVEESVGRWIITGMYLALLSVLLVWLIRPRSTTLRATSHNADG